jgi:arylsulfatase A-like enzyme
MNSLSNRINARFMLHSFSVMVGILACHPIENQAAQKPNVLVILADDLGFSDLACYGGEIETPNLDSLAQNGLRFTQFYNTARCWPSRAALLTGYYAQQVRRDSLPNIRSGGRGQRPAWAKLMPAWLATSGYRSYHSGKWHLDGMPLQTGFDRSYYLKDQGRFFYPKVHHLNDKKLPPVKPGTDFYGTTEIASRTIEFLKEHAAKHESKPFFQYLAFTAPHFPLHALPQDIAKYKNRYKAGWDVIRKQRWDRIQAMGIVSAKLSDVEREVGPPYHFPDALEKLGSGEVNRPVPWNDLTAEQKKFQAAKMAIHAAMVDRMDQEIGRVIKQLKAMSAFENTLIMFVSDNGASAEIMVRTDGHDPSVPMGSGKSYLCLGPGWSTCSNTPFRRHKTWVHEGGISTPFIVHWPKGVKAKGELRHTPGHVIDISQTIFDVTGTVTSRTPKSTTPISPGRSLRSTFEKDGAAVHDELWWLHEGNRSIRVGDWKLVSAKNKPWELFDLKKDRAETNDLAKAMPKKAKELALRWEQKLASITKDATQDSK